MQNLGMGLVMSRWDSVLKVCLPLEPSFGSSTCVSQQCVAVPCRSDPHSPRLKSTSEACIDSESLGTSNGKDVAATAVTASSAGETRIPFDVHQLCTHVGSDSCWSMLVPLKVTCTATLSHMLRLLRQTPNFQVHSRGRNKPNGVLAVHGVSWSSQAAAVSAQTICVWRAV